MDQNIIEQAARELREAYGSAPVEPIGGRLVEDRAEIGYAIQEANTLFWEGRGRRIVGRKIGLTSPAVQAQLGVHEPDYGILFEDMAVPAGGAFASGRVSQPRAEGELAFGLRTDLTDPGAPEPEVVAAIDWMAPAIEIVGSRVRDWRVRLVDTIADNASSGLFVLSPERRRFDPDVVAGLTMELLEGDRRVSGGPSSACLGSPVRALAWLARKMVAVGRPLRAGELVLSGAFGPLAPMSPGRSYRLRMSGFADVEVECTN